MLNFGRKDENEGRSGEDDILKALLGSELTKTKQEKPSAEDLAGSRDVSAILRPGEKERVIDRYGLVEIVISEDEPIPIYRLKLPKLTDREKSVLEKAKELAMSEVEIDFEKIPRTLKERKEYVGKMMRDLVRKASEILGVRLTPDKEKILVDLLTGETVGYGILDYFLLDDNLEDILVIGPRRPVYVSHRKYGMCITNVSFETDDEIRAIIERIARPIGRRVDAQNPLLDARLPDGSRVNATIPPVSLDGSTLTIRKFREDPLTIIDLINYNTLTADIAAFLWLCVEGMGVKPANILCAGGGGSGKTTTLNCLCLFVPERERVISIEDTAELQIPLEHWIRMETRPPNVEGKGEITMDDLVKNTLRMRPDRIIVGEIRGKEARTLFVAMNTGHDGCMGTVHSNNAQETIVRLTNPPMEVPPIMIPALNLIIVQHKIHHRRKGLIRRITEIAEITGMEGDQILLNKLYEWNPKADQLIPTDAPSRTKQEIIEFSGSTPREIEEEIKRREFILRWLQAKGIRDIRSVGRIIQEYYIDPEDVLDRAYSDARALNLDTGGVI